MKLTLLFLQVNVHLFDFYVQAILRWPLGYTFTIIFMPLKILQDKFCRTNFVAKPMLLKFKHFDSELWAGFFLEKKIVDTDQLNQSIFDL